VILPPCYAIQTTKLAQNAKTTFVAVVTQLKYALHCSDNDAVMHDTLRGHNRVNGRHVTVTDGNVRNEMAIQAEGV